MEAVMCCDCTPMKMNRREFMGVSAVGITGASLGFTDSLFSGEDEDWNPDKPIIKTGKKLRVQPILMYQIFKRKPKTSWRPWGGIHTEGDVAEEINRISKELQVLAKNSDFPLQVLSPVKVRSEEEAINVRDSNEYDVPIVYAASGGGNILEACVSDKKNNLIFLRHRSGPIYLWYEIVHNRFLRKGGSEFELDTYRNPAGMDIHDVVVDDYEEILTRLRALYGIKNFIGQRIVALGGGGGWCCPKAPDVSRGKFKIDIQEVSYDDLERRIKLARADRNRVSKAEKWTEKYLALKDTSLHTDKQFVINGFLLYSIFKDLLREYDTNAFTIKGCMGTVIPISETTACLPLSLLNDEGMLAFCESDFNVIPSGILLHYIAGKPVFLNDPTFPHRGIVTCAHCTAPRRMDGKHYALAKIVTHFESDYGATPKVELPIGTEITMICPDASQKRWLGFKGAIEKNPFYDICRSQFDIKIHGDWKKLLSDHRGFHWMMACGDYTHEMAYACPKIGINWMNVSEA